MRHLFIAIAASTVLLAAGIAGRAGAAGVTPPYLGLSHCRTLMARRTVIGRRLRTARRHLMRCRRTLTVCRAATPDRISTLRSTLLWRHPLMAHAPSTLRHQSVTGHVPRLMDCRPATAQTPSTVALIIRSRTQCRRTLMLASKFGTKSPVA